MKHTHWILFKPGFHIRAFGFSSPPKKIEEEEKWETLTWQRERHKERKTSKKKKAVEKRTAGACSE